MDFILLIFGAFTLCLYPFGLALPEEHIKSKEAAKNTNKPMRRCPHTLKKLWHVEVSSFPFAAPPLVADVDGDGGLDIVAAPFGETVTVIEGESGKHLHNSNWPHENLDKSVYSSPLQFDIDGDGIQDVLIITSSGEGLFYSKNGISLVNFSFALPPAYVRADWYKDRLVADHTTISQFVSIDQQPGQVPVDPHVLSTPVLHNMQYLVIPVSFYYNSEDYSDPHLARPWGDEDVRDKFYVTAVATLDLIEFRSVVLKKSKNAGHSVFLNVRHLELQQTPVFGLFTPTVIELDGDLSEPEIIFGSTSGSLFVLEMTSGKHRKGFPQQFGSISGRVSVVDMTGDGSLQLFVLSSPGTVSCLDVSSGQIKWTAKADSSNFTGSRAVDVNQDGHLDIVLATEAGEVYAFDGRDGSKIQDYPYKAGSPIFGNVLVTKLSKSKRAPLDLVFLSEDGELHILASDHSCLSKISIGDTSLIDIVSDNIVLMNQGLELLVATADGSLICLGSGVEAMPEELVEMDLRMAQLRYIYPKDASSQNDFLSSPSKPDIFIQDSTRSLKEVTGNSFYLQFSVQNRLPKSSYNLRVYLGNDLVYRIEHVKATSLPDWLEIFTPDQPGEGLVTIVLTDQQGFSSSDSVYLRFNQLILLDLQWLVVTPFIAMVIILLVNHGFPAKDLLPVTFPFKSK